MKTCFVVMGYGMKTDHATGRQINLDKTYNNIIKPVFDQLEIKCFRASEIIHSGTIDVPMYEWIYKADIVVADLSTSNPNALYELGVRHALRPHTTLVIAESKFTYPFDLSHTVIDSYEHLGDVLDYDEVMRFQKLLKEKVEELLKNPRPDSPVYTNLPGLRPPEFTAAEIREIEKQQEELKSLSLLVEEAEAAKNDNEFTAAKSLFNTALKLNPNNDFLKQRLALVTYKSKLPTPMDALKEAEGILQLLNPDETTDPETLGLLGSVHKRFHELTGQAEHLDKALWYYERGYYVRSDYYNGINVAYLLTIRATSQNADRDEALSDYVRANRIRKHVIEMCDKLIDTQSFQERDDKEWIYQTLAQAHLGLGNEKDVQDLIPLISKHSKGAFDLEIFYEQNRKLINAIEMYNQQ